MAILQVAANRHTIVATGWTSPENAYATTGDNVYATLVSAKNATRSGDFGFPDISSAQIPDGSTINSAKVVVEWGMTALVTGGELELASYLENTFQTAIGKTTTTEEQSEVNFPTTPTLTQLRNAQTSDTVEARVAVTKGNTNAAMTGNLDFAYLEIDYTEPVVAAEIPLLVMAPPVQTMRTRA